MSSFSPQTDPMHWSESTFPSLPLSSSSPGSLCLSKCTCCWDKLGGRGSNDYEDSSAFGLTAWKAESRACLEHHYLMIPGRSKPWWIPRTCAAESQSRCCPYMVPGHLLIIMIMMMHIQGVFFTEKNTLYMVPGHLLIIMIIIMIMMHIYGSRSNADDHDDDDAYTGCIFHWASP